MNSKMLDITFIIVNWNTKKLLIDCVESIFKTVRESTFEIIVVDNGSSDGSVEALSSKYPAIILIANACNYGFAKANNIGMGQMRGEYAVLLNSDTVLRGDAIDTMRGFMEKHRDAGVCGPQLLNGDGSKQISFGIFPTLFKEFGSRNIMRVFFPDKYKKAFWDKTIIVTGPLSVDFIIGACMMIRKKTIDEVGMFDEDYFFSHEETDLCYRIRQAGWLVYHMPHPEIVHFGGQSIKNVNFRAQTDFWRSRYLFLIKHRKLSGISIALMYLLGFSRLLMLFSGRTLSNVFTLFSLKRQRKKWLAFGYLLIWHVRGLPVSMCLQRSIHKPHGDKDKCTVPVS